MLDNIKWLFFDVGSTLVDESAVYEKRMRSADYTVNSLTEICTLL